MSKDVMVNISGEVSLGTTSPSTTLSVKKNLGVEIKQYGKDMGAAKILYDSIGHYVADARSDTICLEKHISELGNEIKYLNAEIEELTSNGPQQ